MRDFFDLKKSERAFLAGEMRQCGGRHSGCLLLQGPLWLLLALAAIACYLVYAALQTPQPPTVAPMLILGGFLLPSITIARRWVYCMYYRRPVIIGARVPITT